MSFTFYKQLNAMDCGPTCLRMVAKYHGKHYRGETLRQLTGFSKEGVSLLGISDTAEKIGFHTQGAQLHYSELRRVPLPVILHWDQNHFVVLVSVTKKKATVADPAKGIITYTEAAFSGHWIPGHDDNADALGTLLALEPTDEFYKMPGDKEEKLSWTAVTRYLQQSRWQIAQVLISLLITSAIALLLPYLTQSMVDKGINGKSLSYLTLVLMAQLTLTLSSTIVQFVRSRLQQKISNRVTIAMLSDFWSKLTRLPLAYFDSHQTGDTIQRIEDNHQIQTFLTGEALTTLFSILNFIVYSIILVVYSGSLFLVFMAGNLLYFGWIVLFLRMRRKINYETFHLSSKENNATLQLVQGMQEIRMNNAERMKQQEWESIQEKVLALNFKSLTYGQWQSAGALMISQGKDIIISFIAARLVVQGQLTFGAMLAIQYIIGQLSAPVQQFIGLMQTAQDARISMERLNEVHGMEDEEPADKPLLHKLPEDKGVSVRHLTFSYPGAGNEAVLQDISLSIPQGKVTAIVGTSGSGKTTLLKLLLKVYEQYEGDIQVGETLLGNISPSFWRHTCGAVLQDGYIFNDTIERNIAVSDEYIDGEKLLHSCRMANLSSFIDTLPNGLQTQLGAEGTGISQGQRQRILIARAVYKDPAYLFFDEATNALDSTNESIILNNLQQFFKNRTVVVVAHRLSTVMNAGNIVVLHKGKIAEQGTHAHLISLKKHYFELVKNQLALGT